MKTMKLYQNKEWLEDKYIKGKLTQSKIAELCGVSDPTICREFKKFDIPVRSHSEMLKGRSLSRKHKKNLSKSRKGKYVGENNSFFGKHHSEKSKKKMGNTKKISGRYLKEDNPNWRGGLSSELYTVDWTETLKRSIRERDRYTCQLCGKEPSIIVHHIDYNKRNCNPNNLITLCRKCHIKTNFKRNYWIDLFHSGNIGEYNK